MKTKGLKLKDAFASVKKGLGRIGKRNITIALAVLLIGGAVYLNWALFRETGEGYTYSSGSDAVSDGASDGQASLVNSEGAGSYFSVTAINRERARDESLEVLRQIIDNEESLEAAKQEALTDINEIASTIEKEANIETLIKAKGFSECVAVISGSNCSVVVSSDGLMENEVAQIQEIVYDQASISPDGVKIIERAS